MSRTGAPRLSSCPVNPDNQKLWFLRTHRNKSISRNLATCDILKLANKRGAMLISRRSMSTKRRKEYMQSPNRSARKRRPWNKGVEVGQRDGFTPTEVKRIRRLLVDRGVSGVRDLALFSTAKLSRCQSPIRKKSRRDEPQPASNLLYRLTPRASRSDIRLSAGACYRRLHTKKRPSMDITASFGSTEKCCNL